jgi:hypothetical protein
MPHISLKGKLFCFDSLRFAINRLATSSVGFFPKWINRTVGYLVLTVFIGLVPVFF